MPYYKNNDNNPRFVFIVFIFDEDDESKLDVQNYPSSNRDLIRKTKRNGGALRRDVSC